MAALLDSVDATAAVGLRDRAVMVLSARLALRVSEVAKLVLDDIDWRQGEIVIRGKGNRRDRLPLPVEVGDVLVAYLRDGRPEAMCRAMFLRAHAPLVALSPKGVGGIVARAGEGAGAPASAHRLRHTPATAILRSGGSLAEVGQVLRHADVATTAILPIEGRPSSSGEAGPALAGERGVTALCEVVEDYLAMRRSLRFKLTDYGRLLDDFVAYVEASGATTVITDAAVAWAIQPRHATPRWWSQRLGVVRGLASHLHAFDPTAEVPPVGLLTCPQRRAEPHLYSDDELAAPMAEARALAPQPRGITYETVIGLIAVTGMRPGEALRLDRGDVDWAEGLLRVVATKFQIEPRRARPRQHTGGARRIWPSSRPALA